MRTLSCKLKTMGDKGVIIYDGECGLCLCTRRFFEPLDVFHKLEWIPYQHPDAYLFGVPREEMEHSVQFLARGRRWSGFEAIQQIVLRFPAFWAAGAGMVARWPKSALAIAFLLSPVSVPIGQVLYEFISQHRKGIPRDLCGHFPAPEQQTPRADFEGAPV